MILSQSIPIINKIVFTGFILSMFFSLSVSAQEADCSDFCVVDIQPEVPGSPILLVSVNFKDTSAGAFINYPYVNYILDENGDTVVYPQGGAFIFGQIGGTTHVYPVHSNTDTITVDFRGIVEFKFGIEPQNGTCLLDYPCDMTTSSAELTSVLNKVELFPNPASDFIQLRLPRDVEEMVRFTVLNLQGETIKQGKFKDELRLKINDTEPGTYFIRIESRFDTGVVKFVIQ